MACLFPLIGAAHEISTVAPYRQAMTMLAMLLLIPPLFHLLSADMLHAAAQMDVQRLLARLYGYLPTIVLGGLAIFPLSVAFIDLDCFKSVIDEFGYEAGDAALRVSQETNLKTSVFMLAPLLG